VFDQAMLEVTPLNFHPLENTATTAIKSDDLLRFAAAQGHRALTLRFPRRPDAV
jgi:Ala-tRNA(Pro) deacylase